MAADIYAQREEIRLDERQLSRALGVSRTPLREALSRLAAEGALVLVPRVGFSVAPLSAAELREIYPIRALLDPEALRLAGLPPRERLQSLAALNEEIRAARGERAIALDDRWHLELLSGCPNRVLLDLIEQFMRRTRRYELALLRERRNVGNAAEEHRKILAALRRRDLDGACAALKRNMTSGAAPILEWLEAREQSAGGAR